MAEKRVHEIAKERGMSASDALLKLRAAGMDVTAAASVASNSGPSVRCSAIAANCSGVSVAVMSLPSAS